MKLCRWLAFLYCVMLIGTTFGQMISRTGGDIPISYDVDVVVVGGSSAAVTAACAAAESGARVFLAAPQSYLGDDLCGTYRLWLEKGEIPVSNLAREMFRVPARVLPPGKGLAFSYTSDIPSAAIHKDTAPPGKLRDGCFNSASQDSVQYDDDVTIVCVLSGDKALGRVHVMAYQRVNDFAVDSVMVSTSRDNKSWQEQNTIINGKEGNYETTPVILSATLDTAARYIKFRIRKRSACHRILLGEIIIESKDIAVLKPEIGPVPVRPLQIKRALDKALIRSNVRFLFGCYGTDVLRDEAGKVAGIVMDCRSGRQAVRAKIVIDATERAVIARAAGAKFFPYPRGLQRFRRIVIGGKPHPRENVRVRRRAEPVYVYGSRGGKYPVIEYELDIAMKDGSFASFAAAEQIARDLTWSRRAVDGSERLFQIPPDPVHGKRHQTGPWTGAENVPLEAFQPDGLDRLFVLSGCADISRPAAEQMLRPLEFMKIGRRIGAVAAGYCRHLSASGQVFLGSPDTVAVSQSGAVVMDKPAEFLHGRTRRGFVRVRNQLLPVLGEYDVVVVGGGTGGAPAGIAAGRFGAKTLVIEYLYGLGGVGTTGLISKYYYGNRVGFTREVDEGLRKMGPNAFSPGGAWNIEWKKEWYRRTLREASVDIWFGVLGTGALVNNGRVEGVVVATRQGRAVVRAKAVVDSTGNACIAYAAGAAIRQIDDTNVALQGTGLPPRELAGGYTNTDWTFIDDSDSLDIWRGFIMGRAKYPTAYDQGQLVDARERRRIIGDYTLTPMDILNKRTYPDTINIAISNFDTHGFTIHPLFMIRPPDREKMTVNVPYRCLLPRGLDRILVTGLGVSAHRDAMPVIRMQADIQNQGYAAGIAAAMMVEEDIAARDVDTRDLQRYLIEKGILPPRVLTESDSYPFSNDAIQQAVAAVADNYRQLEVIFSDIDRALPMLRQAWQEAEEFPVKLIYAHILGMLGDGTGVETLLQKVSESDWDKGWRFTGMGQYGRSISPLDSYIIALGRTGDKRAVTPIIEKVRQLNENSEFSHFRAVALALERLKDKRPAQPLAELLERPGMQGHAYLDIREITQNAPNSVTDTTTRNQSLSELILARALYKCGDYKGLGENILRRYARDLRGLYARHARAVLNKK